MDNAIEEHIIEKRIARGLDDVAFIEDLINTFIRKANNCNYLDIEKFKILILELEKIRLRVQGL